MFHFHRDDRLMIIGSRTFFGVRESGTVMVSPDGCFITETRKDGTYRGFKCGGGYLQVYISGRNCLAHRVVYEVCSGAEIPDDMEIDHIDTDRRNNALSNLRVVTGSENTKGNSITAVRHVVSLEKAREAKKDPEVRRRMSAKYRKALGRPVIGTSLMTGEIREFDSIQSAVDFLGSAGLYNCVMYCCQGKKGITQTHGWTFRYKEDK